MKKILTALFVGLSAQIASAHDIAYTLIQDGYKNTETCSAIRDGTSISIFEQQGVSYVLFSSTDEDSGITSEFLAKTKATANGHDNKIYSGEGFDLDVVTVGEGSRSAELIFSGVHSATQIWLKTYGFGLQNKSNTLSCK